MGKKRKNKDDNEFDPAPKHLSIAHIKQQEKRLIIILEYAQLESVKVGNSFELMNCDDHVSILKKNDRQPGSCRPDIVHQCLLMLLDSPLNRGGLLQVYVHTEKNVLIEVNPQTRIPRTFKRFAGLMVQLLHKFNVRASEGSMKLLKVIKNPVTEHLPVGCKKISTSFSSSKLVNPKDIVPKDEPIAIVVGAMAHGQFFNEILNIICMDINTQTHPDQIKTVSLLGYNVLTPQLISSLQINQHYVKTDYTEETISISNYPLSAALTCTKLCSAFEEVWGVV